MQAVIQAGGRGTRLSSVTKNVIPKPMVEIAGKPLLAWQMEELRANGFTDIILIVGYLGHVIQDDFGDGGRLGVRIRYIEERADEPLGTAGALAYLPPFLTGDTFAFVYADAFFSVDFERMMAFHREKGSAATLFVHPNSHPFDSDLVVLDEAGRVTAFDSKTNDRSSYDYENIVNAGVFLFSRSICDGVPTPRKCALEKDVLQSMLDASAPVYGYRSTEYVKDAGTPERLAAVEHDLAAGIPQKRNLRQPQKAIFLDRDGTLNRYVGLLTQPDELVLEDTVLEAVRAINASEYLAICCTNQPVVARGLCTIEDVNAIHRRLQTLLGRGGAYLDDIIYCPHHPDKGYPGENPAYKIDCNCRKPKTGMIDTMAERHHIDLAPSWMIGDTTRDIQTAKNAGMRSVLVRTGEAGNDRAFAVKAECEAETLMEGVQWILRRK